MTQPIIEISGLHLSLRSRAGDVAILKGIDLSIRPGEAVGIIGPSGSGKTSLLMIAAGLERASGGAVRIAGHDFAGLDEDRLARIRGASIGIVFQSFHLVPTMTALENVALPLEFAAHPDPFGEARRALEAVGLAARADHFPAELSGGEQQRVAIARAIAPRPAILFADEPTGNLDGATGADILRLIVDLRRRHGMTLVLVTHDIGLAERMERVVTLRDGRIVEDRPTGAADAGGGLADGAPGRTAAAAVSQTDGTRS
ncbi:MAG: ATP-binding cassette domain-containing protein [Hyphomicrobiaceae bacterium]